MGDSPGDRSWWDNPTWDNIVGIKWNPNAKVKLAPSFVENYIPQSISTILQN